MAVDREKPRPWRFVINTHRHFDHVGGNQAFNECVFIAPELTRVAMQAYTAEWLDSKIASWEKSGGFRREWLGPDFRLRLPDISFKDELRLHFGGNTFSLLCLGGHNPECSVVYLEEMKILVASDLVFNGRPAYLGEGDRYQWLKALQHLMLLNPDVVIPGHGQVGSAELLSQQVDELDSTEVA
jgi:cyclase